MTALVHQFPQLQVLVFARAPRRGLVKTRLIPALGARGACELHEKLVLHTLAMACSSMFAPVRLYCDDPAHTALEYWQKLHGALTVHRQCTGDLGEKMRHASAETFTQTGAAHLLLIGADCPFIDRAYLQSALDNLQRGADVVFGPATDGGYVLLGMSALHACLFAHIDWGSDKVLSQSIAAAEARGLSCAQLATLTDIDRPEDLPLLAGFRLSG
ncbi:MAG: TIGR04282 family arsenosugar biosynthesis glycosyltransferase [Pseudomonadales bacterium]